MTRKGKQAGISCNIAAAVVNAILYGQARQYAGDRGARTTTAATAPGTVARPHVERPDDGRC
jgi:hypothetical protein